jgi:phenylacetate-coenzyme A ligase PaaK-like adenylate-forming protein
MSAAPKIVSQAAGMTTILRALPGQTRLPFLPREALEDLRDRRVRDTVSYAAEHVPFYRDVFRDEGLDPGEIRTADDLTRLPLVRDEVLPEARHFRSDAPGARDDVELQSSGTTGVGAAAAVAAVREILPGYEVEATYAESVVPDPRRKYRPIVLLDTEP